MARTPKPNVRLRDGRFVADFQVGNKRRRVTLDARTETEAKMIAHRLFVDALDADQLQPMTALRLTIAEAVERYNAEEKTCASGVSILRQFVRAFGKRETRDIDKPMIDRHRHERAKVVQPLSLRNELVKLGAFTKWCVRSGLLDRAPTIEKPRVIYTPRAPLDDGDVAELFKRLAGDPVLTPFYVLTLCGLRPIEAIHVQWSDIDRATRTLRITRSKGRSGLRTIPYFGRLAEWIDGREGVGYLVPMRTRNSVEISKIRYRWSEENGYELPVPHRLRHTIAADLLQNGAPLVAVQSLLGHSSPIVTERTYGHVKATAFAKFYASSMSADVSGVKPKPDAP